MRIPPEPYKLRTLPNGSEPKNDMKNTARILLIIAATLVSQAPTEAASLRIPANTAYSAPDLNGIRVSERSGTLRWNDATAQGLWFGQFTNAGTVRCSIEVQSPAGETPAFRLSVAGRSVERSAPSGGTNVVDFGEFEIPSGYQKFALELVNGKAEPTVRVLALRLEGEAAESAHFNLQPRRNAASVHLAYPVAGRTNISAFYCEVTGVEDPLWTFYMACGWHRGYFGMQVISPTERRIIFSVWDSGNEGVSRDKVADENRVILVAKGDGVYSGDFGNEGTGGHSHLKYLWKTGEKQRFVVTATPVDATHTTYAGYYFHPGQQNWMLISSWKAPKEGGYLRGLHSFSENFVGDNGHLTRKAFYGNQWLRTAEGDWHEITTAAFSHDDTGRADRLDRFMGVEQGQFFLQHGGFVPGFTSFGQKFTRPAIGEPPTQLPF